MADAARDVWRMVKVWAGKEFRFIDLQNSRTTRGISPGRVESSWIWCVQYLTGCAAFYTLGFIDFKHLL